ncbi:hypothetical protein N42HA_00600 [Lactococcus lactis]|nr:hypothetical protein [Lactococcus lactis]
MKTMIFNVMNAKIGICGFTREIISTINTNLTIERQKTDYFYPA